jgi:hypothetical protein
LYCQYVVYLRLLITPLVFFVHCIVRISSIYDFWLLHWYNLVIVLSFRRLFTASDYSFSIICPLYFPPFVNLRLPITSLVYFDYCISVLRLFTDSDYYFGILWSLYCLYVVYLLLLITPLISFGHCIVRTSSIYGFWLLLWHILVIVLSVLRLLTASDYLFGILWSLYCPYFVYLRLLITPLVYFGHCIVRTPSIYASDYAFGIFCHCIVRTSSIYGFWLLLWYILSLYCLYVVYLRLLITTLVYFAIVLSVRRLFTAYDYFFVIF